MSTLQFGEDTNDLIKPSSSEMCPPGYSVVHGYTRVNASGTKIKVRSYIRKHALPFLQKENIHFLYWNSKKKYPALDPISGFKGGAEYDQPIQFWLDYWKERGLKFPSDIDPLIIKALIAVESGFNEKAKTKSKRSTASGLMQLTNQSVRILGGFQNQDGWTEIKDHVIRVKKQDKIDPIVNIALGIRLLSYKYTKIPAGAEKNLFNTLKNYNFWGSEGTQYAEKVLALFEKSRKSK